MATLDIKPVDQELDIRPVDQALDIKPVDQKLDIEFADKGTNLGTVQDLQPLFGAETQTEEFLKQAVTHGINTVGFGLPQHLLKGAGFEIPEPVSPTGAVGAGFGSLAGFIGGPGKAGAGITRKYIAPKLSMWALRSPKAYRLVTNNLTQQGISLGIASGLIAPEEGVFSPVARMKQFGSGFVTGLAFGGMQYIKNPAARITTHMAYTGLPSTFAQEPLETQVFNYGLGAYFGRKGVTLKGQRESIVELGEFIQKGNAQLAKTNLVESQDILNKQRQSINKSGITPLADKERYKVLVKNYKPSDVQFGRDGNYNKKNIPLYIERPKNPNPQQKKAVETVENQEYSKLRNSSINDLYQRVIKYTANIKNEFANDDAKYIVSKLTTGKKDRLGKANRKSVEQLTDSEILSFTELLRTAPETPGVSEIRPGAPKPSSWWGRFLAPGYKNLERMGFGNWNESGLTHTLHMDEVTRSKMRQEDMYVSNLWKQSVGMNKQVAEDIGRYVDGKKGWTAQKLLKTHGREALIVANQGKQHLDNKIDMINIQRAKHGQEPIKKRKDYLPHLVEFLSEDPRNPWNAEQQAVGITLFGTPTRERFVNEIKRTRGTKKYKQNFFEIIDAYNARSNRAIADDFIRRAHQYERYQKKELDLYDKGLSELQPHERQGLSIHHNNFKKFVSDYKKRPTEIDNTFQKYITSYDKWINDIGYPELELRTVSGAVDAITTLLHTTQVGAFRVKTPIRNLGQTMLNVGLVGYGDTLKALRTKKTPEIRKILNKSSIYSSRMGQHVEQGDAIQQGLMKRSMKLYEASDMFNVENSFLAGYYSHLRKHPNDKAGAIKKGDYVAGTAQYIYLTGNRSGLSRGLAGQWSRPLGLFTSWPANYMEYLIAASAPENRANLLKYFALSGGIIAAGAALGLKGANYVGISSLANLFDFMRGKLPIGGITSKGLQIQTLRDFNKLLKEDSLLEGLMEATFYME